MGIFVGFDALNKEQATALLDYAEQNGLTAASSKGKTSSKKTASKKTSSKKTASKKNKDKTKDKDKTGGETEIEITPRQLTTAGSKYAALFGKDARKTVLNHFGATVVASAKGTNALKPEDYAQVLAIFKSEEEFQPGGNAGDDDKNWKEASGKKKKKGKGKDKDKSKKKKKAKK